MERKYNKEQIEKFYEGFLRKNQMYKEEYGYSVTKEYKTLVTIDGEEFFNIEINVYRGSTTKTYKTLVTEDTLIDIMKTPESLGDFIREQTYVTYNKLFDDQLKNAGDYHKYYKATDGTFDYELKDIPVLKELEENLVFMFAKYNTVPHGLCNRSAVLQRMVEKEIKFTDKSKLFFIPDLLLAAEDRYILTNSSFIRSLIVRLLSVFKGKDGSRKLYCPEFYMVNPDKNKKDSLFQLYKYNLEIVKYMLEKLYSDNWEENYTELDGNHLKSIIEYIDRGKRIYGEVSEEEAYRLHNLLDFEIEKYKNNISLDGKYYVIEKPILVEREEI